MIYSVSLLRVAWLEGLHRYSAEIEISLIGVKIRYMISMALMHGTNNRYSFEIIGYLRSLKTLQYGLFVDMQTLLGGIQEHQTDSGS